MKNFLSDSYIFIRSFNFMDIEYILIALMFIICAVITGFGLEEQYPPLSLGGFSGMIVAASWFLLKTGCLSYQL